ncbi:hypothetical protein [Neptuniibacter halophilus]|uniref:hypothetical protein n=1 Tax=Neptuniibacter halophilus TaxID=651666 RepID=UPI0025723932|nr:hypothetical protein [Neptuniibacter halophilus]
MEQVAQISAQEQGKEKKPFFLFRIFIWIWANPTISAFVLGFTSFCLTLFLDNMQIILIGGYYIGSGTDLLIGGLTFVAQPEEMAINHYLYQVYSVEFFLLQMYCVVLLLLGGSALALAPKMIYRTVLFVKNNTKYGWGGVIAMMIIPVLPVFFGYPIYMGWEGYSIGSAGVSYYQKVSLDGPGEAAFLARRVYIPDAVGNSPLDKADSLIVAAAKRTYSGDPQEFSATVRIKSGYNGEVTGWWPPVQCRWFKVGCENWQKVGLTN